MHEGHRLRMYEKLSKSPQALADHELLEILLFNAIPRANTNPLAHRLLNTFGSVQRIFSAPVSALLQVEGVGPQLAGYIKCISYFFENYKGDTEHRIPKRYTVTEFSDYLKEFFAQQSYEVFAVYVLDGKGNILGCKKFTDKDENSVNINPQELTKLVLYYGGKSFILAHNHIHGPARPSASDNDLTAQCEVLCSINNIRLLDHFIYANGELYSYYQSGKMANIARSFHIQNMLSRDGDEEF
ncbi:MAG: hypothetical protein J6S22_01725 [Clostridia bacterium]|nr:hypothetical protein [Clostridia bacterium]